MKIIRCYIENFGKLQNFSYDFKDGINTIKEENGFGKTTFATFIKSMFYGLDASNKTEKSDRIKYKPWQGGIFGGNIEFEVGEKRYRIERFFGNKASDDTFKLYDLDTNLESRDYTENIGEEIFKISKSAYERSTYIPQGQIQIKMEDSLSAKLGNVLESENDVNTSEEAIKKISETMKIYKKSGNKGVINEKKEKLLELNRKLEDSKFDYLNLDVRKNKLEEKNQEIKEKENLKNQKQSLLSQKIEQGRKQAKLETYNNILNKLHETEEKYDKLKTFFDAGIPEDSTLNDLTFKSIEIEKCKVEINNNDLTEEEKSKLDILKNRFESKNITKEDIDQNIIYCSNIQELESEIQKEKNNAEILEQRINKVGENQRDINKKSKIILLIGVLIFIIGLMFVIFKIQTIVGIVMDVIGVAFMILSRIKRNNKEVLNEYEKDKKSLENIKKEIEELQINKDGIDSKINNLLMGFFQNQIPLNERIIVLTNLKSELNTYKNLLDKKINKDYMRQTAMVKKENLETELRQYLLKYFDNMNRTFSELIQEIKLRKNELTNVMQELEKSRKLKEEYEKSNNVEELKQEKSFEDINEQELSTEIKNLAIELDKLNDEKNQYKNQIEVLENKIDENEYLETDIDNLKEEISTLEHRYKILEQTKELLETAKETFASSYLKEMTDGFKEILSIIDDKDLSTNVDINLDVKIDVNGSKKEVKYFSAGYKDLIYICMRFSLIQALFKDEMPFIILDDPFVNLDEEKTKQAIKLVSELSKKYQIVYFTCNFSRNVMEQIGTQKK